MFLDMIKFFSCASETYFVQNMLNFLHQKKKKKKIKSSFCLWWLRKHFYLKTVCVVLCIVLSLQVSWVNNTGIGCVSM